MKDFESVLQAAFDAGRERGRDEHAAEQEYVPQECMSPDFRQWRPTLGEVGSTE